MVAAYPILLADYRIGQSESNRGYWVAGAGAAGYLLGGPIVHLAYGNPAKALGSLGLRLIPPSTMFAGVDGFNEELMIFGLALVPAAVLVDALWIARDRVPTSRDASVGVVPWLDVGSRRAGFGLVGWF